MFLQPETFSLGFIFQFDFLGLLLLY
jgi:hypothetical protein